MKQPNKKQTSGLVALAFAGALAGCGDTSDFFLKEGTFQDFYARIGIDGTGRWVTLDTDGDPLNDCLLGKDANKNGHFELIELDNDDLRFHRLQKYANDDSLEVVYQHVLNQ